MVSKRQEHQEDAKLRVLRIIKRDPHMTIRKIAKEVGISNGSAFYLLTALIDKGLVKLSNFKQHPEKIKYSYLLTPKGIREKSILANNFLIRKKEEYITLKKEILEIEKDIGVCFDTDDINEN